MKVFSLFLVAASVSAGVPKPDVTINLNIGDDNVGNLGGLEPRVTWGTGGNLAGIDVEGGIDVTIKDSNVTPPALLWGKIKRAIPGFGDVSVTGAVKTSNPEDISLDIRANPVGTSVQITGSANTDSKSMKISKVQATKSVDTLGGKLMVTPKYNLATSSPDVSVNYALDGTTFQIDAEKKKLTVAHSFDNNDKISPSITADGDFSVSYTRTVGDKHKLTTTWTPDDSIQLNWSDGAWSTTFKAPLDGLYEVKQGIKVNMKRSVDMF